MTAPSITVRLQDDQGEQPAVKNLMIDIYDAEKKIGLACGELVYRHLIPIGCFYEYMEDESQALYDMAVACFEKKYGRCHLESISEHDDLKRPIFLLYYIQVEQEYKRDGSSDALTLIVSKILGIDPICNAVFTAYKLNANHFRGVAVPHAPNLQTQDSELKYNRRLDANAFLRNSFTQHDTLVEYFREPNILVSHPKAWKNPVSLSHQDAMAMEWKESPKRQQPIGIEKDFLDYIKQARDDTPQELQRNTLAALANGVSIQSSFALHAASARNTIHAVEVLLQHDPLAINCRDADSMTPLMWAARSAAGRHSLVTGIPDCRVIEVLLEKGADKSLTDGSSLTAFGHFLLRRNEHSPGQSGPDPFHPTEIDVMEKLKPYGPIRYPDEHGGSHRGLVNFIDSDDEEEAGDTDVETDDDDESM